MLKAKNKFEYRFKLVKYFAFALYFALRTEFESLIATYYCNLNDKFRFFVWPESTKKKRGWPQFFL